MDKVWYIHTVEYYLAITRNEVWIHGKTWINIENIMPSEKPDTKDYLYEMSRIGKSIEKKCGLMVA